MQLNSKAYGDLISCMDVKKDGGKVAFHLIKSTKTKDYVIFRELPFEEGDIFSKTKVIQGLRNLYNLQFFSSVQPETPPGNGR